MTLTGRQMSPSDGIRTLTIPRPETTFIETLTLGNGVGYSTDVPVTVAPDPKPSSSSSSHVGAILSGVAAVFVLLLIIWFCGRKDRRYSRPSRSSSRRDESGSTSGGSSSDGWDNASGSSGDRDHGSAASDIAEEEWKQPAQTMPGMPRPVARQWAVPPGFMGPLPGMSVPGVVGMGVPAGYGLPPMMGRGGGPPPMHGGPSPTMTSIVDNGGPPVMPQ